MRHALSDRSELPDGADAPNDQPPPSAARPRRVALSHRQARRLLALALDDTTEPELAERLRLHMEGCARCQQELGQVRQAEAWFVAQPIEVPQMAARQDAAWSAIQARIAADAASLPAGAEHLANGHAPGDACAHSRAGNAALVSLVIAGEDTERGDAERLYHPLPVPAIPVPLVIPSPARKLHLLTPRKTLLVTLAASFIMTSLAALVLAHLPGNANGNQQVASITSAMTEVLDPGDQTPTFSFDAASRHLLALTGSLRYTCLGSCPHNGPPCLQFSMLDVASGKTVDTLRPACTAGKSASNATTFLNLLDDSANSEALLIGSDQQVQAVDSASGSILRRYSLACCASKAIKPLKTLLDQHDDLLLTAGLSGVAGVPDALVAQDVTSGQVKYKTVLDTFQFREALVSNVTGWLYLWSQCAMGSGASCVDIYEADSGRKIGGWQDSSQETPLAADPTNNLLYVRVDHPGGQSETLVMDGRSGETVGHLPAAQAMAINGPLHHAYLLDDDGVDVVDTRTLRRLSTLPVLAHDEGWVAPAADKATGQVYLPIQRGKLLVAQDDAAGQLHLNSTSLEVVLNAERAMSVDEEQGEAALYPWELPIGPGAVTAYHPLSRGTPGNCELGWVPARSTATVTTQGNGEYSVLISLAWDDQFAHATAVTPAAQSAYPYEHSWLYRITASGTAERTSDQGAAMAEC